MHAMKMVTDRKDRPDACAFTLPELVAVVLVAVLLVSILAAGGLQRVREEARRSQCEDNVRRIGRAIDRYEREHEGLPDTRISGRSFEELHLGDYLEDPGLLSCPSNSVEVELEDGGSAESMSYYIDPLTPYRRHPGRALLADRNLRPREEGLAPWTENHGPDGVNVLFVDGSVRFTAPNEEGEIGNPHLRGVDDNIYLAETDAHPEDAYIAYEQDTWEMHGVKIFWEPGKHQWTVPGGGDDGSSPVIVHGAGEEDEDEDAEEGEPDDSAP